jgi:ethanolamine utilization microcompartment shell protein EutS
LRLNLNNDHATLGAGIESMTPDSEAIALLRDLARRYCAVSVTFADCGCCTVELFAGDVKVIEEDKDLLTATRNAAKAAGGTT